MGEQTKIAWTDHTFNPWIGCTPVATGCQHCYAEADFDKRRHKAKWGPQGTRLLTSPAYWKQPRRWQREAKAAGVRRRVFCGSLCDVFEDFEGWLLDRRGDICVHNDRIGTEGYHSSDVQMSLDDVRGDLFRLIDQTPDLDWLLLTKRPENIRQMWQTVYGDSYARNCDDESLGGHPRNFRKNVWLGCSASTQEDLDAAVPHLLKCRDLAPVLFLSLEPLVGPIDLEVIAERYGREVGCCDSLSCEWCAGTGLARTLDIDWVIVGGESGKGARSCDIAWIRFIVQQCKAGNSLCFVKQFGAYVIEDNPGGGTTGAFPKRRVVLRDPKGGDPDEWPEETQVREFPRAAV